MWETVCYLELGNVSETKPVTASGWLLPILISELLYVVSSSSVGMGSKENTGKI